MGDASAALIVTPAGFEHASALECGCGGYGWMEEIWRRWDQEDKLVDDIAVVGYQAEAQEQGQLVRRNLVVSADSKEKGRSKRHR